MKHTDAHMLTQVQDPVARDNFQKLNRLFANGEFAMSYGNLLLPVENMVVGQLLLTLHWQKLGRLISLEYERLTTTSKVGTSNPTLTGGLPPFLRPRAEVYLPVVLDNPGSSVGWLYLSTGGTAIWVASSWTNGAEATLFGGSVSYLGV